MPAGRPLTYSPETIKKAEEYLALCVDGSQVIGDGVNNKVYPKVQLPNIGGLALHLGVNKDTVSDWRKKYPEFSDIVDRLLIEQEQRLLNGGLSGTYNASISKLILTKHGYVEKSEVDANVKMSIADEIRKAHE
jgi:hypothetical protein